MKQVATVDPSGRTWVVRRRWIPWSIRWRGVLPERGDIRRGARPRKAVVPRAERTLPEFNPIEILDLLQVFDPEFWIGVAILAGIVIAAALLIFFVVPIALLVVEVAVFLLAVAVIFSVNTFLRRPWLVDALTGDRKEEIEFVWRVVGWHRSSRLIDAVQAALRTGVDLPNSSHGRLIYRRDAHREIGA